MQHPTRRETVHLSIFAPSVVRHATSTLLNVASAATEVMCGALLLESTNHHRK
jgi:hypothetical protein